MRYRGTRAALAAGAALCCALLAAGCGPAPAGADARPTADAAQGPPPRPVPHGKGSRTADDFNGDGHPDLVLDSLLNPDDSHDDDPGIGIVYGSAHGLDPAARRLLTPARHAAPTKGVVPAVFDAEAACDLDGDGFTDLVVSTDPPYDGRGRPPVPVQILFGSPAGLTARAVKLRIPDRARFGNEWPDQPVCGDFDGDGAQDLVVTASGPRASFLRGPFTRQGAPRAAGPPLDVPGTVLAGLPSPVDADRDGADDLLVRSGSGGRSARSRLALGGARGPATAGAALPAGYAAAFGRFDGGGSVDAVVAGDGRLAVRYGIGTAAPRGASVRVAGRSVAAGDVTGDGRTDLVVWGGTARPVLLPGSAGGLRADRAQPVPRAPGMPSGARPDVLRLADFDHDGRADLVLRTVSGGRDAVTVHRGTPSGFAAEPTASFSTAAFSE
ncbi:VCBS repeat-containing protein [Streptomyces sp. Ru73]|uniref:FG-GAP repeat domain-containing protein n=1 Tax=Streptomyces sp. Ru73 TaxID=2080748 RepID=UPI0021563D12|nr:VCBS repeat-containing protein [Streptomyces sp. Ru73]